MTIVFKVPYVVEVVCAWSALIVFISLSTSVAIILLFATLFYAADFIQVIVRLSGVAA